MAYPASTSPVAKLARGVVRLASGYSGSALGVYNNDGAGTLSAIGFTSDALNTTTLDAHLAGGYGRVTRLYDQIGTAHADNNVSEAPRISDLSVGGHRAVIFDGGSQPGIGGDTLGLIYALSTAGISGLGVTAKDYTYMAVVQMSASAHCNQAGAPGLHRGTLLHLVNGADEVLRIFSDGIGDGITGARWAVSDGSGFSLHSTIRPIETTPVVITVTSGVDGVRVWQNEELIAASATRSALVRTAAAAHVGKLATSVVGSTSEALQGTVLADMLWAEALTDKNCAFRRAMLYNSFNISLRASRYDGDLIIVIGDSNASGYKVAGLWGWEKRLPALLAQRVCCFNFAVPGQTVLYNTNDSFPEDESRSYASGQFLAPVLTELTSHKGNALLIIDHNGNDYGLPTNPTAADVYAGHLDIITQCRAVKADLEVINCTGTIHLGAPYVSKQQDLATLIRNGAVANDYQVADFMADSILGTNPGVAFADSSHRSAIGHARAATLVAALVPTAFGWA